MNQLTDEQLMAYIVSGNDEALSVLYDRYAPAVMGFALRIVRDTTAAEDIVQETFWRIWNNSAAFQARKGKFASWMFGIVRNLAIDNWRRQQVRPQAAQSEAVVEQIAVRPDPAADVVETVWTAARHSLVRDALAVLPPEQFEVIELAYFYDRTRKEIAEETANPLGTVHTRARLALQKLRQALEERGIEALDG